MNNETLAKIATLAAFEAAEIMAKKAGCSPEDIITAVITDPEGNTARYFGDLVQSAIKNVPAMLAKTQGENA